MKVVNQQATATARLRAPGRFSAGQVLAVMLVAAALAFVVAWYVKGEAARYGGLKWAVQSLARNYGQTALSDKQSWLDWLKAPYYALRPVELPQIVVDVKFKNFQKLQQKRQQALAKGVLVTEKSDYVSAKIRHDGVTSNVKLRLKGDLLDHLKGDKWSFRIKVKGKDHLYGMRVFSLQSPKVRGWQGAPLYYATLQHYGVLAPRYKLVNAVLNGHDMGLMSIEEHFSKEMLEASGRKESVIIRFDESLVWAAKDGGKYAGLGGHFDNYHLADIDGFGSGKIAKSPRLQQDYEHAVGLLRAFEQGVMAPSSVFDAELMGWYIAIAEMWGSWHSFSWRNMRFYYNPITSKLEPIGYDPDIQNRSAPGKNRATGEPVTSVMREALLRDPVIFSAFKQAVHRLADDFNDGSLQKLLQSREAELLPALRKEYFLLRPFELDDLAQRLDWLQQATLDDIVSLYDIEFNYPALLQAYLLENDGQPTLELANISPASVTVTDIEWLNRKGGVENEPVIDKKRLPLTLPPAPYLMSPDRVRLPVGGEMSDRGAEVVLRVTVNPGRRTYRVEAKPYYAPMHTPLLPVTSVEEQIALHQPYLQLDASAKLLTVKRGKWQVQKSIIIPEGYTLRLQAGAELAFSPTAAIVSYGALEALGSKQAPVVLTGINNEAWPGVVVMRAPGKSRLIHTHVDATNGKFTPNWHLTGGVTFYQSDVQLQSCVLEDSRGEDALNIVHSNFVLDKLTIRKTASDAFDSDFSKGEINGGLFENIGLAGGGDAVDVSGTDIRVNAARFVNIDDKAISVGEKSRMQASNLDIRQAGTAAASKDGSELLLKNTYIQGARIAGLMAYIKKPEYGPARIEAEHVVFDDVATPARAQKGSVILLDGKAVETVDLNVKQMYKTVMKKGLK